MVLAEAVGLALAGIGVGLRSVVPDPLLGFYALRSKTGESPNALMLGIATFARSPNGCVGTRGARVPPSARAGFKT